VIGFHRSNANPWKAADFSAKEQALLNALNEQHKVVLATFVKPYALSKLEDLPSFEGVIVGYQNNKAAQKQVAQLLLGKKEAKGKLPCIDSSRISSWTRNYYYFHATGA
jgi:hypothetical protein